MVSVRSAAPAGTLAGSGAVPERAVTQASIARASPSGSPASRAQARPSRTSLVGGLRGQHAEHGGPRGGRRPGRVGVDGARRVGGLREARLRQERLAERDERGRGVGLRLEHAPELLLGRLGRAALVQRGGEHEARRQRQLAAAPRRLRPPPPACVRARSGDG